MDFYSIPPSPSATRGCWWFLRQCKTAASTKWRAATGTTDCLSCVGNTLAPKQCCSALEASTARVWWACSSHRIPPRQVRTWQQGSFYYTGTVFSFCIGSFSFPGGFPVQHEASLTSRIQDSESLGFSLDLLFGRKKKENSRITHKIENAPFVMSQRVQ